MSVHKDKNEVDELFKESFENAELKPSDNLWLGLETKLLNEQVEKDRKKIFFLRWLAAASITLLIGFVVFYEMYQPDRLVLSESKTGDETGSQNIISHITTIPSNNIQDSQTIKSGASDNNIHADKQTIERSESSVKKGRIEVKEKMTGQSVEQSVQSTKTLVNTKTKDKKDIVKSKKSNNETTVFIDPVIHPTAKKKQNKTEVASGKSTANKVDLTENRTAEVVADRVAKDSAYRKNDAITSIVKDSTTSTKNDIAKTDSVSLIAKADSSTKKFTIYPIWHSTPPNPINDLSSLKIHHWWVDAMYSPDYSYQHFVATASGKSNEVVSQIKDVYQHYAKPKYGYTVGIQLGYYLNDKWSFQTGFLYSNKGEKTAAELSIDTATSGSSSTNLTSVGVASGFISDSSLIDMYNSPAKVNTTKTYKINANEQRTVNYKYEYFDVPLMISYHIDKNKFNFHLSAGASANFFYGYKMLVSDKNSQNSHTVTPDDKSFKKVYYSALLSVGAEYKFNAKFGLNIEPTFRYAITSNVNNTPINGYLYSLGLATSLRYHF